MEMERIFKQQLSLSIREFFINLFENKKIEEVNYNDVRNFINDLKEQEYFLNEQKLYDEDLFLKTILTTFEENNLYKIFSSSKKEANEIITEIFSNKVAIDSKNVNKIENCIKKYYINKNTDALLKAGEDFLGKKSFETKDYNQTSDYILELSQQIEGHKIKEGLGILYSAVLQDKEEFGKKALASGKKEFFDFVNKQIIGANESVFYYDGFKNEVKIELCSQQSVFDAFLRNEEGKYSILIATHSHDTKTENETAFTQPLTALYLVKQIEEKLLAIKDGDYTSIEDDINFIKYANGNRINYIDKEIKDTDELLNLLEQELNSTVRKNNIPKGQIIISTKDNPIFEELAEELSLEDRPGPRFSLKNHTQKIGKNKTLLSKYLSKNYIDFINKKRLGLYEEKYKLQEELLNEQLLVNNNLVDFSNKDNTNDFIGDNLLLLKKFLPKDLKEKAMNLKSFRSLIHLMDNNTNSLVENFNLNIQKDNYGNILLNKENISEINDLFKKYDLTVRFYGRNQGKNNHAFINEEEQKKVSKESVCYVLGQYTYIDYLISGKNGVIMDFDASIEYVENVLLKNTITETNVKLNNEKDIQVIQHQLINDPDYTRKILKNILKDYIFEPDVEKVSEVFNKNGKNNQLDEITLSYISSISQGFWSFMSSKIEKDMDLKSINEKYFEFCLNHDIKVKRSLEEIVGEQLEIQNAATNNKAKNPTTIAELKHIKKSIESAKLMDFVKDKEKNEIEKMLKMGLSKESILELKVDLKEKMLDTIILELNSKKNRFEFKK